MADILRRLQVYKYHETMRTIIIDEANQLEWCSTAGYTI